METRYTVQYWFIDEHDTLDRDFDTLPEARQYARQIDFTQFKEITAIRQFR